MRRASYRQGVAFIAQNDEPTIMSEEDMCAYASVHLLSELFDISTERVARDVVAFRLKEKKAEAKAKGRDVACDCGAGPPPCFHKPSCAKVLAISEDP